MEELSGKTALVTGSTDGSAASSLANSGKPTRACWSMTAMPREALGGRPWINGDGCCSVGTEYANPVQSDWRPSTPIGSWTACP
jgi:hypothetical protein